MVAYRPIHPDDLPGFWELANKAAKESSAFNIDCRYLIREELRWYRLESSPCQLPDGRTVWDGAVIDITERRRAEEALAEAREQEKVVEQQQRALLSQKLKTSLTAAAIAHEIRQPLSQIQLNCNLALGFLEALSQDQIPIDLRNSLLQLTADSDRVMATIERMRMLLRNVESVHSLFDLAECLDSAIVFLKQTIRDSAVVCLVDGLEAPCPFYGDASQLQIAIVNLIRNAIEAMESVAPGQRRLKIILKQERRRVFVLVADSGPGFPPGYALQAEASVFRTSKSGGMGIGLFVAQTAVANHRGNIEIGTSPLLGGAEVVLELPGTYP
jgi:signal transduction histidine kinase